MRMGFSSFHTGPSSSESSGTPIQNSTYTEPAVGLSASSLPNTAAITTYAVAASPNARSSQRVMRESIASATARGNGRPARAGSSRGSRQRNASARNDTSRAMAAPVRA